MELINNFNGISFAVIVVLSYCAVLKNTKRNERSNTLVFGRKYK